MEEGFKHLYQMNIKELEQLLRKVNFTNQYYADCYYGAYELDANPHEALWYMSRFVEWVDEEIDAGELAPECEGVWKWMRNVTVHEVAEELYNFLNCWDEEGHRAVLESIRVSPVKDYFYPWNEDKYWREILRCWERNETSSEE